MQITIPSPLVTTLVSGFRPLRLAKAGLDVLRCLRFSVTPGTLAVTGTDLDQSLIYTGALPTDETACFLVPFAPLVQVAKLTDGDITVCCEEGAT